MYLIDGYNVLFVLHRGRVHRETLEAKRGDLIREIERYCAERGARACVFFDNRAQAARHTGRRTRERVEVVFTPSNTSADDEIVRRLSAERDKKSMKVVTSDREIVLAAERERVTVLSSAQFLRQISAAKQKTDGEAKCQGISKAEVNWWMKEFGL